MKYYKNIKKLLTKRDLVAKQRLVYDIVYTVQFPQQRITT